MRSRELYGKWTGAKCCSSSLTLRESSRGAALIPTLSDQTCPNTLGGRPLRQRRIEMISNNTLYNLANSLGMLAMLTVVLYHFVAVNSRQLARNGNVAGQSH
ncbi:hypothetical protein BV20DRAFT_873789 [Pilatotrama ljubarskyi]|nr:hypothetical protein BV20DRAFT_873789 [Pilatotrama ljubarskyi]